MPEHHPHPEERHHYEEHYDEIDLADVVLAIWRRRWLFVGTFVVVFGLSVVYALIQEPKHEFGATIQIGSISDGEELRPIEDVGTVRHRFQQVYIPRVRYEYRQQNPEKSRPPEINVETPNGVPILSLSLTGSPDHADRNRYLLERAIEQLTTEHDLIFDVSNTARQARLAEARNVLASLEAEAALIKSNLERIDEKAELVEANIESLENSVAEAEDQRRSVAENATDDQKAMTLLLIDSRIQDQREELSELRERLQVDLKRERDQLEMDLSDNQRQQENQQYKVEALTAKEQAMERTRAVVPPTMSLDPVGSNKRLILALGFVLAGMLAVLAVGISGLLAHARRKMAQEQAAEQT